MFFIHGYHILNPVVFVITLFIGYLSLCNLCFMSPLHLTAKSSLKYAWELLQGGAFSLVFLISQLPHVLFNYSSPLPETAVFSGKLHLQN